jgi:hypothetical protein
MSYMQKDSVLTIRIDRKRITQLEKVAEAKDVSVSWLVRQAIDRLLLKESNARKT